MGVWVWMEENARRGAVGGGGGVAAHLQHLELAGEDTRLWHVAKGRGAEVFLHSQEAGPEIRLERETAGLWELVHLLVGLEHPQRQRFHLPGAAGRRRYQWCRLGRAEDADLGACG